ncbi:hypothetical protein SSAG_05950 [Streptomyces sp. Mg1]|nr:hypothetical protein SSAG_05950 [Streptomyces sp. Mg1]
MGGGNGHVRVLSGRCGGARAARGTRRGRRARPCRGPGSEPFNACGPAASSGLPSFVRSWSNPQDAAGRRGGARYGWAHQADPGHRPPVGALCLHRPR